MLTLQNDEQNDSDEINFQSYIDAVKDSKIVWDIFVNLMKDLSHKNINSLKQLNEILLNELKISIQEKRRYNQFDDIPLGAQSLTSIMADLRQDIKTEFLHLAGAFMEHFLEGIAPLRHW